MPDKSDLPITDNIDELIRKRDELNELIQAAREAEHDATIGKIDSYWSEKLTGMLYVECFIRRLTITHVTSVTIYDSTQYGRGDGYMIQLSGPTVMLYQGGYSRLDGTHDNPAGMQLTPYAGNTNISLDIDDWHRFDRPYVKIYSLDDLSECELKGAMEGFVDPRALLGRNAPLVRMMGKCLETIKEDIDQQYETGMAKFKTVVRKATKEK